MRKLHKAAFTMVFMAAVMFNRSLDVSAEGVKDVFDAKYYADTNEDLKAVYGYDENALFNHYITCGLAEGRCGSPAFNVVAYRLAYPDLEAAFGNNWDAYVNHYYTCGMAEGRNAGVVAVDIPQADSPGTGKEAEPADNSGTLSYEQQVVNLVNEERSKAGLSSLNMPSDLASAAGVRAKELEQVFSHTRPDGRECFSVLNDMGISYHGAGENIASGYTSPSSVMDGWMNSPGHRANILTEGFKNIGVGYWKDSRGRQHWVQLFSA